MRSGSFCLVSVRVAAGLLVGGAAQPLLRANTAAAPSKAWALDRLEAYGFANGGPAFVRAVASSHRPTIDLFLAAGIDVNARGEHGRTALLTAIRVSDWSLVPRLLAAGADVTLADEDGVTPLMATVVTTHLPTFEELLKRGAPAGTVDRQRHTALHYAVAARQHAMVERLLQAAAPDFAPCCEDNDLLHHAFETRDPRIVSAILPHSPPLPRWTAKTCNAFNTALSARDLKLAQLLIAKHQAPPTPTPGAQPYVAYAVARGDLPLLQTLLDCGASPNATLDAPGDEALRALIGESFVRYYFEKEPGFTPLMFAAALRRADCVRLLLDRGAARTQYTTGRTRLLALYFAAWAECPEAVQLLVGGTPPAKHELRIEVDLGSQEARMIKNGVTVYRTDISSGTENKPTPTGEFVVTDKKRHHRSSIYPADMPFFMRLSCRDFGLHQGYVTGRPASHGCIRLPGEAARKLFAEVPVGTWVSVIP